MDAADLSTAHGAPGALEAPKAPGGVGTAPPLDTEERPAVAAPSVAAGTPADVPETTPSTRAGPWRWLQWLVVVAAVGVVVLGVVLRFWADSPMWLDEALTANIARLPLSQLHGALMRDGAPPLYYVLLHFWMGWVGTSDLAIRSLSGLLACATLPLVWIAARRLGGRAVGVAAVVLLASSPFAVRYATENRMYALVGFLCAVGVVALQQALRRPRVGNVMTVGIVSALLLYTHYWSLYLVGVTGVWLGFEAWRGPPQRRQGARWALVALAGGALLFVPWFPTFVYQSRHTGTPWAAPANFAAMVNAVTSFAGGATNQGRALALLYFALAGLGLFGVASGAFHIDLDLRTRPQARGLAIVTVGTLAAAVAGGYVSGSTFQDRYASVIFIPLLLLVALGVATMADRRVRVAVLAVTVACGIVSSLPNISSSRTEAGLVAAALARQAHPGDVVGFCPDQLGPAVDRLVPPGRYDMVTFPRGTGPAFVDWVDYAQASALGNPAHFTQELLGRAGAGRQIWLVWAPGYQTFGDKCEQIVDDLSADPAYVTHLVVPFETVNDPFIAFEQMELLRFSPRSH